jgi:ribosomal protein S18 acetylase RimI-like enzyme
VERIAGRPTWEERGRGNKAKGEAVPPSTDLPDKQPTVPTIVRLDAGRADEAVAVFVDAFSDDSWARHMFRGNERSFRRDAGNLFRALVMVRLAKREPVIGLQIGGTLIGVATVEEPGPPTTLADGLRSVECARALLALAVGARVAGMRRIAAYGDSVAAHRPSGRHFYLLGIAVLRSHQGRGFGSRLLNEVHAIVESAPHATGIGLDTDTPSNVALYRHFGYQATALIDAGGIAMTCMFRPNPERPGQTRRQASP